MLKEKLVVCLLILLGGGSIVSGMESKVSDVQRDFYNSTEYTSEEKDHIWDEAWKIIDHDLSHLSFGGNSYDK